MKHYLILIFFVLLLPAVWGCGNKVQIRGKVTFEEDGSPLTFGTVKFVGEKTQATGHIQKDGTYRLGEVKPGDGIMPGLYRVTVYAESGGGSDSTPVTYHIDRKFKNPATSGLTCEVKRRMTHDIIVTKPLPGEETERQFDQAPRVGPPPGMTQ